MADYSFKKELYSRTVLLKATYNFTDRAYIHLDADELYYHVSIYPHEGTPLITREELEQEMLAQAVRHEIYLETKNIRELLLGRALATSLINEVTIDDNVLGTDTTLTDSDILTNWFETQANDSQS